MKTQESNKIIAEFMGWGTKNDYLFPPNDECMHTIDGWNAEDIPYHTSWDWLMPVVDKCFDVFDQTNDGLNFKLNDALLETNIDSLYKAVVEFIKEYNENK